MRGGGTFQKASIDEAYLEPARRTLTAELFLVQEKLTPKKCDSSSTADDKGMGLKRSQDEKYADGPSSSTSYKSTTVRTSGGRVPNSILRGESGSSDSQDGSKTDQRAWDMAIVDSSGDGQPDMRRGEGKGKGIAGRERSEEEEEENRLLEAGGLLGRRIQQAVKGVLGYDCSVGVAENKVIEFGDRRYLFLTV